MKEAVAKLVVKALKATEKLPLKAPVAKRMEVNPVEAPTVAKTVKLMAAMELPTIIATKTTATVKTTPTQTHNNPKEFLIKSRIQGHGAIRDLVSFREGQPHTSFDLRCGASIITLSRKRTLCACGGSGTILNRLRRQPGRVRSCTSKNCLGFNDFSFCLFIGGF